MQQSSIDTLEKYRPKLFEWVNDQTCHLNGGEKQEIQSIIQLEFIPGYRTDLFCGTCVVKMLELAFSHLDNYLATKKEKKK